MPQQVDEEGDEEEYCADNSKELSKRPVEQPEGGVGDKEQAGNLGESDYRAFVGDDASQMISREQYEDHSRQYGGEIDEAGERPVHQLENETDKAQHDQDYARPVGFATTMGRCFGSFAAIQSRG